MLSTKGCSSVGYAWSLARCQQRDVAQLVMHGVWHAVDKCRTPKCGKGFFSHSQLSVQMLLQLQHLYGTHVHSMHQHLWTRYKSQALAAIRACRHTKTAHAR